VLHELGCDISVAEDKGRTPVHLAAFHGHPDCIRVLHELGCDVSVTAGNGYTPVHSAAFHGNTDCIRVLHELGCDICDGSLLMRSAVDIAAQGLHLESVLFLVSAGADVAHLMHHVPSLAGGDAESRMQVTALSTRLRLRCEAYPGSEEEQCGLFSLVQLIASILVGDDAPAEREGFELCVGEYLSLRPRLSANTVSLKYTGRRRVVMLCRRVYTKVCKQLAGHVRPLSDTEILHRLLGLFLSPGILHDLLSLRLTNRCCESERRFPLPTGLIARSQRAVSSVEVGLVESFVGGDIAYFVPTSAVSAALGIYEAGTMR